MRILVITYNFLQFYNPSSIQARRFFLELAENGHQITVLTNKEKNTIEFQHKNIEVIEVFSIKKKFGFKLASILRFRELNFMPDWDLFFWNPFIWLKLRLKININEFDVVHTIASPFSTHLIPLYFVKRPNTLFVAQFYDPWVDNSYINLRFNFFKKLNLRLEKMVAEKADLIIHTNSIIVDKWEKRYGVNTMIKNLIIPLCMENNIVNKVKSIPLPEKNSKIIISHVGSIYGKRNLNTLIKALQFIFDTQKNILNDLTINLVGTIEASELKKLKFLKFKEIFNLTGNVSHEESLIFMSQASWLLLLEEEGEEGLFFPSKLTDYLAVYKPIMGIIPKNCVSREILSENGHHSFDHEEVENIANFIISLSKRNDVEINNKISTLEVKNVVSIYEHSIEKLMDNKKII